jgi:hypothetical protein
MSTATRAQLFSGIALLTLLLLSTLHTSAVASHHYTDKQIAALAERVGKTYWIRDVNGRTPAFFAAPNTASDSFQTRSGDSFQIIDLVGTKTKNPFFKALFTSGQEGYFPPELMLEELNLTLVSSDPVADERRRAEQRAEMEKQRKDWIDAQPWPTAAKEAALKGQAIPGMTHDEVRKIAGTPNRVIKVQTRGTMAEEHWIYPDKQLVFQQGLLARIITKDLKKP